MHLAGLTAATPGVRERKDARRAFTFTLVTPREVVPSFEEWYLKPGNV
jgi:hypothetical protein